MRLDRIREEWAQLGIRTLLLEGRARDEGLFPGMRPVVVARAELEGRLPPETVVESSSTEAAASTPLGGSECGG